MATTPTRAIRLIKIAGVQIEIDYSWLFVFVLVLWSLAAGYFPQAYPGYSESQYWTIGLVAALLFFSSVLFHELCHAIMGNRLGENIDRITLFIFGGMAHLTGEPKSAGDEFFSPPISQMSPISPVSYSLGNEPVCTQPNPAGSVMASTISCEIPTAN